jgi:hypothetical protein
MLNSRLVSTLFVVGVTATATFFACGGDDGGGGGGSGTPDAKVFMDAKVYMDAPPGMAGLGAACSQSMACGSAAPQCISVGSGSTWCTASCGTSSGSNMPPTGGDAICQGFTTTGTPKCVFYSGTSAPFMWSCGILCGTAGSNSYGTCPSNMTCSGNVCI